MFTADEKPLSAQEMLDTVQHLKDQAVQAMFGQRPDNEVLAEINGFLHAHRMQILDVLDDAFYAHLNGGKK